MKTYSITLSDGTVFDNLRLNGNNFISSVELSPEDFSGKLDSVTITSSDGSVEDYGECELIQLEHVDGEWWFILHELTPDEIYRRQLDAEREMYLDLLADQEYRLCLIELGII